ncbi:tRNA (guanine-N(7)-)-methyltransferase [Sphaceloma murrayae]|uniref:tRNA (Guanine-N(7)-)-methyltransferase n=1 Tax=Sphaceloma murrayae TaxID=2082308 RepID=A0A2K1QG34_9PEZI|nr:tRNA (guanine-N(7)-)-methyltransferase [Sphaceloma murrayae]
MKKADLDNDPNIVDFERGLSQDQKRLMTPSVRMTSSHINAACSTFWKEALGHEPPTMDIKDIDVWEHEDYPGLRILPGVLPLEAQILFISQVLHRDLANPLHKINLTADHDLTYPPPSPHSSLFSYLPTDTPSTPKSPSQPPLPMSTFLSRKLRWLTLGTQYDWPTRSYPRHSPTPFPSDLSALITALFPAVTPQSGVCLLYGSKDFMPVHRDVSEQCQTPLASFSFGCDGIFLLARGEEEAHGEEEKRNRVLPIRVRSGDCVYLSGEARWAWHAMPRTVAGTAPKGLAEWPAVEGEEERYKRWKNFMGGKRLNVSCRQVWEGSGEEVMD